MSSADFKPIIKKSTLSSKKVDIAGTSDFSRNTKVNDSIPKEPLIQKKPKINNEDTSQNSVKTVDDDNYKKRAIKTQKMSPDVILKINTLKPYIKDLEELNANGTPSINEIIDMLVDNYVNTKLTTRQLEGYKAVYQNLYEHL